MRFTTWHQIHPWKGSKSAGFEELICQLAHVEPVPDNSRFYRKGTPDAGLECFWVLPNGEEWGWQAKYFPDQFRTEQWKQCDKSVRAALDHHPKLTRLFLCFPYAFPDARIPRQKSALRQWKDHCDKWALWARGKNRVVEMVLWDEHQLLNRLSKPENQGRLWFWFDQPALNSPWFERQIKSTIALAGERYTPDLHFDVPTANYFDAVGRTPAFWGSIHELDSKLRTACSFLDRHFLGKPIPEVPGKILNALHSTIASVSSLSTDPTEPLKFSEISREVQAAQYLIDEALNQLWRRRREKARQYEIQHGRLPDYYDTSGEEVSGNTLTEITSRLSEVIDFCNSPYAELPNLPAMLLVGEAGLGKTHLACSVAERRVACELPTLLLLGQQFDETEPWTQILRLFGLACSRDEFLGALDSAGEASRCRALLTIDALNEGSGMRFWKRHLAGFLTVVSQYPHIGVVLTVRQSYAETDSFPNTLLVRVEHHGFAGRSETASRHFFHHYGLVEPNVPLLGDEFENPLLLKLFCTALRDSGEHEMPRHLLGVNAIFGFVLGKIDTRLAEHLDYLPSEKRVARAVLRVAELMAESRSELIPLEIAKRELDRIHPNTRFSESLLHHLIAEHVLQRVPLQGATDDEEAVRFTYQRLSDYLIVEKLFTDVPKNKLREVFGPTGSWSIYTDGRISSEMAGLVEAMAIKLPEKYGLEIHQLFATSDDAELLQSAFLLSIVRRQPSAFSAGTFARVKKLLNSVGDTPNAVLEAIVAVAARPNHPLNADWLDQVLRPLAMAKRDAFWSTFLFGKTRNESSVQRLIEWAWAEREKSDFSTDVLRLASLTLTWFFTASDRFVRDRATKALVALLNERISEMLWLLEHFEGVEEPYIQERLYAAAYGCAMHTSQKEDLRRLAQWTYDVVFRNGSPAPSVLLRDHARGIIQAGIRRGVSLDCEPTKLLGPFRSKWPKSPPSLGRLRKRFTAKNMYPDDAGLHRIYKSVTDDDFKHYVINDVALWSNQRRTKSQTSPREMFQCLLRSLPEEAEDLKHYASLCRELSDSSPSRQKSWRECQRELILEYESYFRLALGKGKGQRFLERVAPYLKEGRDQRCKRVFPQGLFQRLILHRVLQLGWTSERFNDFDIKVPSEGRKDHKAERIGKKYQWIAYDELHARISDNFLPSDDGIHFDEGEWESNTWSQRFRDLDPSLLVSKTGFDGWSTSQVNWWTPCAYNAWDASNPLEWLKRSGDLPSPTTFMDVKGRNNSRWMMLSNYVSLKQKQSSGASNQDENDSYEIHYIFRTYLARRNHAPAIMDWGKHQNWINHLLPSPEHQFHQYLLEHYWSPYFDRPIEQEWIDRKAIRSDLPHPIVETTAEYLAEDSNIDCSVESDVLISIPSRWLMETMGLRLSGRFGDSIDSSGHVVAFDPSTREPGYSALLISRDAFRSFLQKEKLAVFWTLLGEKNIYPPQHISAWLGRLTFLGIYCWQGDQIEEHFRTEFTPGRNR